MDDELRAAEREENWPLVARLRRRRGEGAWRGEPFVIGDTVSVERSPYNGGEFLIGQKGVVREVNRERFDGRIYGILGPTYGPFDPVLQWLATIELSLVERAE